MQILVVDDDHLAAEMVAAILEDVGHQAVIAENAVEALENLSQKPNFDLVISDNHMPLMDGPELCQEMQNQGYNIPFILLSGDDSHRISESKLNIDAYLSKDFSLSETLIEAIGQIEPQ